MTVVSLTNGWWFTERRIWELWLPISCLWFLEIIRNLQSMLWQIELRNWSRCIMQTCYIGARILRVLFTALFCNFTVTNSSNGLPRNCEMPSPCNIMNQKMSQCIMSSEQSYLNRIAPDKARKIHACSNDIKQQSIKEHIISSINASNAQDRRPSWSSNITTYKRKILL